MKTYSSKIFWPLLALASVIFHFFMSQEVKAGAFLTNSPMSTALQNHTMTLLPNGKVLVVGGFTNNFGVNPVSSITELYDPATGMWKTTGSLNIARSSHTATLLPDGHLLIAGGSNTNPLTSAELCDTATGTSTATGSLHTARWGHTATLLPGGKVLVTGGFGETNFLNSAEVYEPATGLWTVAASMHTARYGQTATLLPDGQVLVAGGNADVYRKKPVSSVELYNPATGTWTVTNSMQLARVAHTATLLLDGQVLIAGGYNTNVLSSAELYNPKSGTWTAAHLTAHAMLTQQRCCLMDK